MSEGNNDLGGVSDFKGFPAVGQMATLNHRAFCNFCATVFPLPLLVVSDFQAEDQCLRWGWSAVGWGQRKQKTVQQWEVKMGGVKEKGRVSSLLHGEGTEMLLPKSAAEDSLRRSPALRR